MATESIQILTCGTVGLHLQQKVGPKCADIIRRVMKNWPKLDNLHFQKIDSFAFVVQILCMHARISPCGTGQAGQATAIPILAKLKKIKCLKVPKPMEKSSQKTARSHCIHDLVKSHTHNYTRCLTSLSCKMH